MLQKLPLILFFTLFFSLAAKGQDILFFKDGHRDTVKLKEVTDDYVKYTRYPGGELPVYSVAREDVLMVQGIDGKMKVLVSAPTPKSEYHFNGKQNIFCTNLLPIVFGVFHFNYERLNKKGNWSLRAHLFTHVLPDAHNPSTAALGADINYFPPLQLSGVRFYFGAGVRSGISEINKFNQFTALSINNGVAINIIEDCYLGLQWGTGVNRGTKGNMIGYGYFSINIGAAF